MIQDPYIGMPITLGRPSKPTENRPPEEKPSDNICQIPLLPPGHPQVKPGQTPPPGHPPHGSQQPAAPDNTSDQVTQPPYYPDDQSRTFDAMLLGSLPLAMSYTPMQQWKTTYTPEEALFAGTVFPELNLPFEGRRKGGMR